MNYLERYRDGEYELAWDELTALGPDVRKTSHRAQVVEVATEIMRRVRRNCELIVSRLNSMGYIFGTYPDGSIYNSRPEPLIHPSKTLRDAITQLEAEAGPLPLSLVAFWQEVGAVDLIGMHPEWSHGRDPLVVYPPDATLSCLYEEEEDDTNECFGVLAPDDLHKDNVSGGDPYSFQLPDASIDFLVLHERHDLFFVPYLRMAILQWGGFPGLGTAERFEPLDNLVAGLEPF